MDAELIRDCVHCGFCLPTCPTYDLWHEEMDSPRGRIWLMQAALDGTVELNRTVARHFDRCLGCMACVTSCPSGVRYDRLIELTREQVERRVRRPPSERALRALAFAVLPRPRLLRAALPLARLAPFRAFRELAPPWREPAGPPRETPARGERRARVGLLTGCVQSVLFGEANRATARVLAAHGYEVTAPYAGCCGALALHAGRRGRGLELARRAEAAFRAAGAETIVANAAGCGSHLKEAGLGLPVADVSELLAAAPGPERSPLPLRVAFQDACHLRHAQRITAEPRALLRSIPGLELAEPAEQELCCGSAGVYNLVQPDAARELGDRKAAHVLATGAEVYASANPGCLLQVSAALRRAGRPLPALHPVELLDASLRGAAAPRRGVA
ncbi:MAG TPA: heterodisulfide reductase-related iron-sulfur binding cluster [Gaiellaceae bacterium]|nr:heterodisulfide reductase-related iron-sulfur binding cluster [Gaiellaceae bacterium]